MTAAPAKLSNFEIESDLTQLPGWTVVAGKLHREYRFPNFGKAFGFMKTAAPAGYAVCNETNNAFWAALGQKKSAIWTSHGWWMVAPGSCAKMISESVTGNKIYLRVEKAKGRELVSGQEKFCVVNIEFDIQGRDRCMTRGLIEAGFAETNAKGAPGFVAHVSEAGLVPAGTTSK